MNGLSALWQAVVDELTINKGALGISGAERAETGKVMTLPAPAASVWIEPLVATRMSQNGTITMPTDVAIFCKATGRLREGEAVDAALEIGKKVLAHLSNRDLVGVILQQPDNEPVLEIVDRSSNAAVVGVLLKAEVIL